MTPDQLDRLKTDIRAYLSENQRGHANAKPRKFLVANMIWLGHPLGKVDQDTVVRRAYRDMPEVGSCARGIYLIVTGEDRRLSHEYLHGKATAIHGHEKRIKDAPGNEAQGELF